MICAPDGTSTFAPTAAILPSRMTSVPSSTGEPATVKILACVMAITVGGWDWPEAVNERQEAAAAMTSVERRIIAVSFTAHLRKRRRLAGVSFCHQASRHQASLRVFFRRVCFRPFSLRLSFLFPSGLSFLFRGSGALQYRACGRSRRGHRSVFAELPRRR